jgi:hypothetical protein
MSLLSRDAILAVRDLVTERVEVPEWGGAVLVQAMTGEERDAFEASLYRLRSTNGIMPNLRARFVAAVVIDEAGARIFTEADIVALGKKSAAALERIFAVGQRLSHLGEADVKALEGNSEAGPNGSPGSVSQPH